MKTTIVILVLIVLAAGGYLFLKKSPSAPAPEVPAASSPAQPDASAPAVEVTGEVQTSPAPAAASVAIKNFAFSPSKLSIKAGTKVTWTNGDSMAHTVTSDSGSTLNSGSIASGQSFSFTFATPGTYAYHCAFHPSMKGTITVTP
jgi:plastocyanin